MCVYNEPLSVIIIIIIMRMALVCQSVIIIIMRLALVCQSVIIINMSLQCTLHTLLVCCLCVSDVCLQ